ncbi:SpoIIE family protein phosphatase [Schlesneria sp. T3-172]|uniref:SpoIIE family protein phosphatase n=1 Tax=Schlesneria sphaerica TaxID=3373610 RepID=UPI0037C90EB6
MDATGSIDSEFASLAYELLDNTSTVVYAKDLNYRYLLVNRKFEELFHIDRASILGKTDFDVFPLEMAEAFQENDRIVKESGMTLRCEEVAPHDDGPHRYVSVKFPLRHRDGALYAVGGISTDITEKVRAEHEIASLEYQQNLILDSVADGICGLDSAGRIAFLNHAAERMLEVSSAELEGRCHSQIVVPPKPNGLYQSDSEPYPVKAVLNGNTAIKVSGATFRRRDGTLLPVEYTVSPVCHNGVTVGAVLAFQDATARLKQREIEQEVQTALRIQVSLYPKQVPQIAGFDFASFCQPCSKACGDYFDFIPWGNDCLGIAVGDVSGHGLGPAVEMVATRAVLRTLTQRESAPHECLNQLNRILSEDLPDDMFVTLFLASLNTRDRTLSYAAAGHEAVLLRANGDLCPLKSTGTILGMQKTAVFGCGQSVTLQTGDLLLIATDGLAESTSPDRKLFGQARIIQVLRQHQAESASQILHALMSACDEFRQSQPSRDDVTAVAIKLVE